MAGMVRIRCWLLLLPLCFTAPLHAQERTSLLEDSLFVARAAEGLDYVYNLQFEEADSVFQKLLRVHPEHPVVPFLQVLTTWWHILLDLQDNSHDRTFLRQMKEVFRASDRRLRADPDDLDGLFFKGLALSLRARLYANRGQQVKALLDSRKAIGYVVRLARLQPENDDFYFGWGVYDYFAAYLPERYPWLKPLQVFFPDGNRERGLKELERVFQHGKLFRAEAAYFLLQIYYFYEPDFREAVRYITFLRTRYPENAYFHALEARVYARWGQWGRVYAVARDLYDRYRQGRYGYGRAVAEQALYWMGRYAMQRRQYPEALAHFAALDTLSTGRETSYYRAYGLLRTGMIYDALGERPKAIPYYRKVLLMEEVDEAKAVVWKYLKEPYGTVYRRGKPSSAEAVNH